MRMPFGKHAGLEVADISRQYLRWLRRQPWLGAWLVKEIDAVLNGEVVAPSDEMNEESFEETLGKWQAENG